MTSRDVRGYFGGFVVLGLVLNVIGPSLTHLAARAHVGLATVSWVFVAQSLGYLAGSIVAGGAYDRGGGNRLFAASLAACAVALVGLAAFESLSALLVWFALIGLAAGSIDVGGNTLLVWSTDGPVAARLNAMHLCFGIGAVACPALVDWSLASTGGLLAGDAAFAVVAALVATVAWRRPSPAHPHARGPVGPPPSRRSLVVISIFYVVYVGVELGFAGWVHAYAEAIHLGGRGAAALLTTTFWIGFIAGRLLASRIARAVSTTALLLGATVAAVGAAAALVVGDGSPWVVWCATAVFGVAVAPQFPTMIAHAERSMVLTGSVTSWFISASALGGLALPRLIGQLFESSGAQAMPRLILIGAVATLASVVVVVRTVPAPYAGIGTEGGGHGDTPAS